ncbi:NAD(P)-dependent dehydrogenase (short-subunit alcohol dehydrogenase family) [Spinactinospora alkalitolerans]|uniref:NAD(P)-dependent dehydrogenase (Short-subunit alcohol dehydrogenase family) n=1 Tax=Spinactinospora alkalitolerans TaxID=687207 RepID=A0A852TYJ3_9ACTN|nr:SDR family oxidoreductase [Spinactinospora alkalitolerans]NYE47064.1 NAD(P)-dependent dehydrogenase (short-subunit alcohol dehydrogenase family) [Spinactinospora alkalitolerans]
MRVKDRVAVVTGASSGIGRATALALAKKGAAVVLAARGEEALEQVAEECRSHGGQALAVPTDVADHESVEALARRAAERFGRIDVWVNAAALTLFGPFSEVPLQDFRRVVDVNLMGYVHGARAALPHLREQGRGVLVNVSSIVGVVAQPYTHAYGVTKFAIRGLSASLRQELRLEGARRIHVCSVLPATIDTPFFQHAANYTGRKVVAMPPVYTPESVARAIVDLVRVPRREVVVGPGRGLVALSKTAPGLAERIMGTQVDRAHLSRKEPAAAGSGSLYRPAPGTGSVHGGWHGRRRTAVRRLAAAAALGAVAAAGVRRCRR